MGAYGIAKGVWNICRGWDEGGDRMDKGIRQLKWGLFTTLYNPCGMSDAVADCINLYDSD